jgi:hypothetical protein
MSTYTKVLLSGDVNGRQIKVVESGSPGTTIHTAIAGTDSLDEIWLYAVNSDDTDQKLTIEYGGTTDPDDLIEQTLPAEGGYVLIVPGLLLQNSLVVKAFAAEADKVLINGFVNRIT